MYASTESNSSPASSGLLAVPITSSSVITTAGMNTGNRMMALGNFLAASMDGQPPFERVMSGMYAAKPPDCPNAAFWVDGPKRRMIQRKDAMEGRSGRPWPLEGRLQPVSAQYARDAAIGDQCL